MIAIGVTGGIGMGKSTAAQFLEREGVAVVDTDHLSRELVKPGMPALEEIIQRFGRDLLDETGALIRSRLAAKVFPDENFRRELEAILHPRIRQAWQTRLDQWRKDGKSFGAVIIPLLFEVGAEKEFDYRWCVACSAATQRQRLLERGWSEAETASRLAAQLPIQKKIDKSDFVIWTEGSPQSTHEQIRMLLSRLQRTAKTSIT